MQKKKLFQPLSPFRRALDAAVRGKRLRTHADPTTERADPLGDQSFRLKQQEMVITKIKRTRDALMNEIEAAKEAVALAEKKAAAFERAADQQAKIAEREAAAIKRDRPGLTLISDLQNELAILRGEITEGQLEVMHLGNLGVGADKLAEILVLQEKLRKERERGGMEAEAKAMKDAALSAQERLAIELKRVEALRMAGLLTDAEAAKIVAAKTPKAAAAQSLMGTFASADALVRRISEAAGGRKAGGAAAASPAQQTATATKTTAKATAATAKDAKNMETTLREMFEFLRDALNKQFAGVFS